MKAPNLVLCGFMGCGKTTLARHLAERTGMPLLDTDDWIVRREGMAIPRLFAERGEPYFRAVERAAIAEAACRSSTVIATGGGAVVDPGNAWRLISTGIVFYIHVPSRVLWQRIGSDPSRPIAAAFSSAEALARKLASREPFYEALPHRIEAGERSPGDVADEIFRRYEKARDDLSSRA